MNFNEYADREMLVMQVANALAGELRNALLAQDMVSFAVPGGTTPGPIFEILSAVDLDWDRVRVMLSDERWVDETDAQSNARLLKQTLFTGHAAKAKFLPFYRAGLDAGAGAAEASASLDGQFPISVLLLGMGADMHTASLFPGGAGLTEALAPDAANLCAVTPAGQDMARVTLPAHALSGAISTHVVIFGDEKREAVERANSLPPQEAPISVVLGNATVHWAA